MTSEYSMHLHSYQTKRWLRALSLSLTSEYSDALAQTNKVPGLLAQAAVSLTTNSGLVSLNTARPHNFHGTDLEIISTVILPLLLFQ